jgi:hypothetical protein
MASLSLCQFMFVLIHGRRIQFAVDVILHCADTTLSYSVRETLRKSIDATLVVMECETSVETLKWVVFFCGRDVHSHFDSCSFLSSCRLQPLCLVQLVSDVCKDNLDCILGVFFRVELPFFRHLPHG